VQAEALREALHGKDVPANVYVGMRYWHPFTEEAIEQVGLDIYPKYFCFIDFAGFVPY
jgi:protoheme ferro-lyase